MKPLDFDDVRFSRRQLLRGSAATGAVVGLGGIPALAFADDHSGRWTNLRKFVASYVDSGKVANIVISIGAGDAEPEFVGKGTLAFGGMTKADGDSLYRIYSQTKPITGIATMMLIEDGKLGLDQPLYETLPAFKDMKVQKTYDGGIGADDLEPAKTPITIRHLLTHTAGLGYSFIQKGPISKAYNEAGLVPGQVSRFPIPGINDYKPVRSLETFADLLATMPLVDQPGNTWHYSVSLDLLGRVIEVASGMSFDQFLQQRLFGPCGMTDTHFTLPQEKVARLTTNYGKAGGEWLPVDPAAASIYTQEPAFPFGGAGLVCSPRDYDRFQRMLLNLGEINGTRVMSEPAVRLATSNIAPEGAILDWPWIKGAGFGAGGRVGLVGSDKGSFGWGGAAGTLSSIYTGQNMRMGLYTQYMPSEAYDMMPGLQAAFAADLAAMAG